MRFLLIILCCVFAAEAQMMNIKKRSFSGDFMELVKSYGYPVESYDVQTEDGYILDMFRIPLGRQENKQRNNATTEHSTSSTRSQLNKGAVFLMHGILTNSESFIYGGPSESLALYLADAGYDVFLGNARGTTYGQRHTTLDPKKDAAFWRFCWNEIGMKDLPALINKALSVSGQKQLSYIGHNEGTTSFYVLASELPEMRKKIERQLSLGPIVFMKYSDNEVLQSIELHAKEKSWMIKNLGVNSFSPTAELLQDAKANCMLKMNEETLCNNAYFLLNGYNSRYLNQTTLKELIQRVPSTASVREILHLVQLKETGRFEKYSEGGSGQGYDLSKVTTPTALFYTPKDNLSRVPDVQMLADKLPNVYWQDYMENLDNNLDLLYSKNMNQILEKVQLALQQKVQQFSETNSSG